jgi:5-methylcytosine-specific restriction endonuclease McrA
VRSAVVVAAIAALALAVPTFGKGSSSGGHSHSSSSGSHHSSGSTSHSRSGSSSTHHSKNYAEGVPRDSHGRIKRSEHAKDEFKKSHPCPSTGKSSGSCPGYTIDHLTPLKRGGADDPSNMQWQTNADAKAKDKVE